MLEYSTWCRGQGRWQYMYNIYVFFKSLTMKLLRYLLFEELPALSMSAAAQSPLHVLP